MQTITLKLDVNICAYLAHLIYKDLMDGDGESAEFYMKKPVFEDGLKFQMALALKDKVEEAS